MATLDFVLPHRQCVPTTTLWQRMTRFHLVARCILLGTSATTAALAWWTPGSATATLMSEGGSAAATAMVTLTVLTCLGWLDVVVNDLLPDRWQLPLLAWRRYWGFSALGAVYWMHAFAGIATGHTQGISVLLAWYLFVGFCCGWFAAVAVAHHAASEGKG